jgi:hypothetical protein
LKEIGNRKKRRGLASSFFVGMFVRMEYTEGVLGENMLEVMRNGVLFFMAMSVGAVMVCWRLRRRAQGRVEGRHPQRYQLFVRLEGEEGEGWVTCSPEAHREWLNGTVVDVEYYGWRGVTFFMRNPFLVTREACLYPV